MIDDKGETAIKDTRGYRSKVNMIQFTRGYRSQVNMSVQGDTGVMDT